MITTIGIDISKQVFQLHGSDASGKKILSKTLKRHQLVPFLAQTQPCLIAMEACSGASFWAREFEKKGHQVKLIAPQFVKPFVKSNKNDAADAEAIAEAVLRPTSSGGKEVLLGISKRGDVYIRSLLIHGARAMLVRAQSKKDRLSIWAQKKRETRGFNRATVAVANKNARMIWALLKHKREYQAA